MMLILAHLFVVLFRQFLLHPIYISFFHGHCFTSSSNSSNLPSSVLSSSSFFFFPFRFNTSSFKYNPLFLLFLFRLLFLMIIHPPLIHFPLSTSCMFFR